MRQFLLLGIVFSLLTSQTAEAQILSGRSKDLDQILSNISAFSKAYISADYAALAKAYSEDGKILPPIADIISGRPAIQQRWTLPENIQILDHKIEPVEIIQKGKMAYDHGYYHGATLTAKGDTVSWQGKYVIVWKKVKGDWKIYLDIWNGVE